MDHVSAAIAGGCAGQERWLRRGRDMMAPASRTLAAGLLASLLAGVLLPPPGGARAGIRLAGAATAGPTLAPLKVEAVRQRYGQEALFRLRLGVDAARDDGRPCTALSAPSWNGSPQQQQLEAELAAGRPYRAGQLLGAWQRHQQRCHSLQPGA